MKFPTPLILQTSSSLLLPNPLILKDVFGVDFDSTEGLLRWFHKVTESDVPVDNKTLNRVANGGGKWSTKQKIAQPLLNAFREKTEHQLIEGMLFPVEYFSIFETLLSQPDQKSAEESLESTIEGVRGRDCKSIYQIVVEWIGLCELFSVGGATLLFLQERILAQAQLEETEDITVFRSILRTNTMLDDESINALFAANTSSIGNDSALATLLFMDFFYQLVVSIEIDLKQWILRDVVDHEMMPKKPGAMSQLIAESIRYDDRSTPFGRALLHIGKMLGKIQDKDPLGYKALAQYIPDAINSDLKPADPNDKSAVEQRAEDTKNNKYRRLCVWKSSDPKERKTPKDKTLIDYFGALMSDDSGEGVLLFFLIAKMALGFGKMHDDFLQDEILGKEQLATLFDRYFEYYQFTITRVEQKT